MSRRLTKAELAASLRAAGRTPEEIAATLEWPIDDYRKWEARCNEAQTDLETTQAAVRIYRAGPDLLAACEADAAFHEHFRNCVVCEPVGWCLTGAALLKTAETLRTAAIRKARGQGVPS